MKNLIVALLLIIPSIIYSQFTRHVQISNRSWGFDQLSALYKYDEKNNLRAIQVLYLGMDNRYLQTEILKRDTIFVASPKVFVDHLDKIISFFENNEPEVSTEINDHLVFVTRHAGMKRLYLYDKKGEAFVISRTNMLSRMKDDVIKWTMEAGVDYK